MLFLGKNHFAALPSPPQPTLYVSKIRRSFQVLAKDVHHRCRHNPLPQNKLLQVERQEHLFRVLIIGHHGIVGFF